MTETYVTLIGQIVGNDREGFRTVHNWDGFQFATKAEAVSNGFKEAESDDFNVGIVKAGKLASVWWMDDQINEDAATLAEIGREIGLRG